MEIKKFTKQELKGLLQVENLLPFNRSITAAHVSKMAQSVKDCGLLRAPIIGKLNYIKPPVYAIIDGQHLVSAVVAINNEPEFENIDCIVRDYESKREVIKAVAKVNNTMNMWKDRHYLSAWYLFGPENEDYYENYKFLNNLLTNDHMPCSFLITLYCTSKDDFKEGKLLFRDREFSDKVYKLALMLKNQYDKQSPCLNGLEVWCKRKHYHEKKAINFQKLESRMKAGIRNKELGSMSMGRDDFHDWIEQVYTRL